MLALLLGPLLFAVLGAPALAADDPTGADGGERPEIALRLSPAVLEIADVAGPSRHDLRVDNLGSQPLTVVAELADFTVTEDGTTQFLGPDELSAVSWATLDVDTFELAPDARRDVTLTIEVPDDAEPGERYLSVIFAVPGDPDSGGNITVTHRVAVKLYVSVPGERLELVELGELSGPRLLDGPATLELRVHNRGNVHRRFEEDTQLRASNGDRDVAFDNFTVLGGSTRVVQAVWDDPPLLCWCTVEVEIDDGRGNLLTASTRVIAFPLRLSLALLALTAGLAILAIGRRRRREARFEQRLAEARRESVTLPSGADPQPPRQSRPIAPSGLRRPPPPPPPQTARAAPRVPLAPPAQPAPPAPYAPAAHAATATLPTAPSTAQPLDGRMFTAHGTQDGRRRRRGQRRR